MTMALPAFHCEECGVDWFGAEKTPDQCPTCSLPGETRAAKLEYLRAWQRKHGITESERL